MQLDLEIAILRNMRYQTKNTIRSVRSSIQFTCRNIFVG